MVFRKKLPLGAWALVLSGALGGCGESPAKDPPRQASEAAPDSPLPKAPSGLRFRIDPSPSRMTAHVGTSGVLSGLGHVHTMAVRDFEGEVVLTPDSITPASLRWTARPASISETDPGFSDADRQKIDEHVRGKALEVSKFDRISFRSTAVSAKPLGGGAYQLEITGTLELHGVKKPVTVPTRLELRGDELTATGEFKILHSDFGMERLSAALGAVRASDEIRISFDVRAKRSA